MSSLTKLSIVVTLLLACIHLSLAVPVFYQQWYKNPVPNCNTTTLVREDWRSGCGGAVGDFCTANSQMAYCVSSFPSATDVMETLFQTTYSTIDCTPGTETLYTRYPLNTCLPFGGASQMFTALSQNIYSDANCVTIQTSVPLKSGCSKFWAGATIHINGNGKKSNANIIQSMSIASFVLILVALILFQ